MARMSNDDVRKNKDYGDSSQLTNWILDSGATCHMTPEVTDFIPGSLEICAIDTYNLRSSSSSLLSFALFPFSLDLSDLRLFSLSLGGLGHFAIR